MSLYFGPRSINGLPVLVQVRAGTMTVKDGMATANPAKGFLSVIRNHNGLVEFIWSPVADGTTGAAAAAEQKCLVTFGDALFEKVEKCKDGSVYSLLLGGSKDVAQTRLYWLQEKSKDEVELLSNLRTLIGHAECVKRLAAGTAGSATAPAAGRTATAALAAAAPASGPISNEALQQILQNLRNGGAAGGGAGGRLVDISLQQMLSSDEMLQALREEPEFYMSRVAEHLPPSHSSDIIAELRNPQASAAAATLQAAVSESPNTLNEVLTAFGLPRPSPPAGGVPLASATALCEAIIKQHEDKAASPALNAASNPDSDNVGEQK